MYYITIIAIKAEIKIKPTILPTIPPIIVPALFPLSSLSLGLPVFTHTYLR